MITELILLFFYTTKHIIMVMKNLILDPHKDQHVLMNHGLIKEIVSLAQINPNDTVLEIGAGSGNLTRELAKYAKKVISFEIDEKFAPFLADLPTNVEMHFKSAWPYIQMPSKQYQKREYNKIVSNLPYSLCEPLFHNLAFLIYDKIILMVPEGFYENIEQNGVFNSFFIAHIELEVDRNEFNPKPDTNSVVINLEHKPNPLIKQDLPLFLRQYIYQHESQLVKNSLREGIITYFQQTKNQNLTKNFVRNILDTIDISSELVNRHPDNFTIYREVSRAFKDFKIE
ncbi:hypothetical protein CO180_02305 [candidate division WWE3 bacterium CG_4_9_14_3_um_filter_41_6]|nr:MAG: hypothetical protein CO180_02305 [candidate division WWE3 bacterium CG_4_9_14_3_um_filter_41_6]